MLRLIILFTVLSFNNLALAGTKNIGKILISKGKVFRVVKGKKKKYVPLKKNSKLNEKDVIKTAKKSFAKILLTDKTSINVGPSSLFKFQEYIYNQKNKSRVNVLRYLKGKFRTKVNIKANKGDRIKIISSKKVALGVRGTEILSNIYKAGGKLTNDVALLSGKGELVVNGKKKMIKKGDLFNSNKGLEKIEKLSIKEIEKLKESDQFLDNQQNSKGEYKEDVKQEKPKKEDQASKKKDKKPKESEDEEEEWVDCEEDDEDEDCEYDVSDMIQIEVEEE
jgi:hypothetical protein